jgi:Fe(3+) dicitrate transport protein
MLCRLAAVLLATTLVSPDQDSSTQAAGAVGPLPATTTQPTEIAVYDRVRVVDKRDALRLPGSSQVLGSEDLEQVDATDIHRALRLVPGISVQEEDGYGLRPNIGMRGTGVERSQKITLLEDGVLIAPAPYSAPSAYYFPNTGRMDEIEVRKGSSSIRQGPYTTGGVINLISTAIPSDFEVRLEGAASEDDGHRFHGHVGSATERFAYLVETYQLATGGFKHLDGGGDTGTEVSDVLAKLRYASPSGARRFQSVELKLGRTDQDGNETYLGLTAGDFEDDPYRRYSSSQRDNIDTEHEQVQLRHWIQFSSSFDLTTTVYRNDFFRNWYKLDGVLGTSVSSVLDEPTAFAQELAILRGEIATSGAPLSVRANRRDYYGQGAETILAGLVQVGSVEHRLEAGVRYHEDQEDRFQEDDRYDTIAGQLLLVQPGRPGSQANRISSARALAAYVQDRIAVGRLVITPGLRIESIDLGRRDFGRDDPDRLGSSLRRDQSTVEALVPGLGLSYAAGPAWSLFGGVHKGFSPPAPGESGETEAEESLNFEAGVRYQGGDRRAELVAFYTDYDNLLGTDTLSGGGEGTGDQFNGGEVTVRGIEASYAIDLGRRREWRFGVPVRLSYTLTEGEFDTSFETGFADWAPRVERGDELPYLSEHQGTLGVGLVGKRFTAHALFTAVSPIRTNAGHGPISATEEIGAHGILDLSLAVPLPHGLELFSQIRNLTDEVYVAARRPAGLRPGLPRTALIGVRWSGGAGGR